MAEACRLVRLFNKDDLVTVEALESGLRVRDSVYVALCDLLEEGCIPDGFIIPIIHALLTRLDGESPAIVDNPPRLTMDRTMALMRHLELACNPLPVAGQAPRADVFARELDVVRPLLCAMLANSI